MANHNKHDTTPLHYFKQQFMKRVVQIVLVFFIATFLVTEAKAQYRQKVYFLQNYNNAPYHFGFLLGMPIMDYSLHLKENYQNEHHAGDQFPASYGFSEDKLKEYQIVNVESHTTVGFSVGVIGDIRLSDYFNFRFSPTLSLSSKFVKYNTLLYDYAGQPLTDSLYRVESHDQLATFLEFPFHIKYRSKRYNNIGAYLIAGVNPKVHLGNFYKIPQDKNRPMVLQTNRGDVAVEIGAGFDIYNQWFKMGVELKFSYGLINVLKDDVLINDFVFNTPLKEVRNKQLQLCFTFE